TFGDPEEGLPQVEAGSGQSEDELPQPHPVHRHVDVVPAARRVQPPRGVLACCRHDQPFDIEEQILAAAVVARRLQLGPRDRLERGTDRVRVVSGDDFLGGEHHQVRVVDGEQRRDEERLRVLEVFIEHAADVLGCEGHGESISLGSGVLGFCGAGFFVLSLVQIRRAGRAMRRLLGVLVPHCRHSLMRRAGGVASLETSVGVRSFEIPAACEAKRLVCPDSRGWAQGFGVHLRITRPVNPNPEPQNLEPNLEPKNPAPRTISRLTLPVVLFVVCWTMTTHGKYSASGDEPHYLMVTQSLWADGDLDLTNNYRNDDGRLFGAAGLAVGEHAMTSRVGGLFPSHDLGVPIVLTPIYAAAQVAAAAPSDALLARFRMTRGLF